MTVGEFLKTTELTQPDAKVLAQFVTGLTETEMFLHPETEISDIQKLNECVSKRLAGLPIAYITESRAFYKDVFKVCEGILIPQPDTETLVEEAVKLAKHFEKKDLKILDLCSGSGCIGISVAKNIKPAEVVFSDLSPIAVSCTKENAERLLGSIKSRVCMGNLFEKLNGEKFDMILTNPPYIPTDVISTLESDVRHEPTLALDGGKSGLEIIEEIVRQSSNYLNENGALLMEIGYDQGPSVEQLFKEAGFKEICVIKDLGQRNRVVKGLH